MPRLFLVRHAESLGNRDRVFTATPDVPLTERGREQARAAAEWLVRSHAPGHVVSSPFARARETAAIIAGVLRVPVSVEPDLRERDYGTLAGLSYDTPRPDYERERYWLWRPDRGETLVEVATRVGAVLDRVAGAGLADDVVVVSHGAVMMAAQWHVSGAWPPAGRVVRNAGIVVAEHRHGRWIAAREIVGSDDGPVG
jgi:probable phosphoglycerate mutase